MTEESDVPTPPRDGPGGSGPMPTAVLKKSRSISIVWLIPIIAALVGGFLAWKAITDQGPAVTILFDSASGLIPEKTKVRYKDVEVGVVETISITDDLDRVSVTARLVKEATPYLNENTRFWVVRAQVSAGTVRGLETLLGGAYIEIDLSVEGASQREFVGLPEPPLITSDDLGTVFTLHADELGSLTVGAPVYYRSFPVGKVTFLELDENSSSVSLQVFVESPHDQRVDTSTRFWNASGIDVVASAEGVQIDTPSIVSMLIGGVSFDNAAGLTEGGPIGADMVFTLYPTREASQRAVYANKVAFVTYFEESVAGLVPGAPVEFRGIKIGQVLDIAITYDEDEGSVEIPVLIEIEPERIRRREESSDTHRHLEGLVANGLRSRLATANLLTGALKVEFDLFPDAAPAEILYGGTYPEIPSVPGALDQITNSLRRTLAKIEEVPIDEIGVKLDRMLGELDGVAKQLNEDIAPSVAASMARLDETLVSVDGIIGPDAAIKGELERLLLDLGQAARSTRMLAERLEQHPEDLLRGKR